MKNSKLKLIEVAEIRMGQSPPSSTYNTEGEGVSFLQGKADFGDPYPLTEQFTTTPVKIAESGDILMSVRAPVGDVNIADKNYCIGRGLAAIRAKGNVDSQFLYYFLKTTKHILTANSTGSTFKSINRDVIENLEFPDFDSKEQSKIVFVLNTIQKVIEQQRIIVKHTNELKSALIHNLFTGNFNKRKLKDSEIGNIPESWNLVMLGTCIEKPEYGYTASATDKKIGPKFLRITDIQDDIVEWESVPFCECSDKEAQKYFLNAGDIVVARIGATTGKTYLVKDNPKAVFASYLIRIKAKKNILPEFLNYYFQSTIYWDQINSHKGGKLKGGVNAPILQSLLFPEPSTINEQQEVVDTLTLVDYEIKKERKKLEIYEELFNVMLTKLIGGEVGLEKVDNN